jgi:hypothetical protein
MACCQRDDLVGMGTKKTVGAHLNRVNSLLSKVHKGRLYLALGTRIREYQAHPMGTSRYLYLPPFVFGIDGMKTRFPSSLTGERQLNPRRGRSARDTLISAKRDVDDAPAGQKLVECRLQLAPVLRPGRAPRRRRIS